MRQRGFLPVLVVAPVCVAVSVLAWRPVAVPPTSSPVDRGHAAPLPVVAVLPIQPFPHYAGGVTDSWREVDPFVPWKDRHPSAPGSGGATGPAVTGSVPAPVDLESSRPPLVVPPFTLAVPALPQVIGSIGEGRRSRLRWLDPHRQHGRPGLHR